VPALARATGLDQGRSIPPRLLLLGAVLTALGLWMVARLPQPPDERVPGGSTT